MKPIIGEDQVPLFVHLHDAHGGHLGQGAELALASLEVRRALANQGLERPEERAVAHGQGHDRGKELEGVLDVAHLLDLEQVDDQEGADAL